MAANTRLRILGALAMVLGVFVAAVIADSLADGRLIGLETSSSDSDVAGEGDGEDEAARAVLQATGTTIAPGSPADRAGLADDGDEAGGGAAPSDADEAAGRASAVDQGPIPAEAFEPIRNRQDKFSRFADVPSDRLQLTALTEAAPRKDNGASPSGNFRVACEYSHFSYDDPIVFPSEPGRSHLHMFFGNTETDAFTTQDSLVNRGGATCSGFELNRSAYWTPALLDGRGNIVVPDQIIIYYKTKHPNRVKAMPQGLQMISGNTTGESFRTTPELHWSCGRNGHGYKLTNRIPDCNGDVINASIQFPNCWDGVNLTSDDLQSHLTSVNDQQSCPASHPERLPQISILLYFPGADSVDGWHLSSDRLDGFNGTPGGTLHADWWGGWNDETMDLWTDGCMRASRNCSFGQTGTARQLAGLNPLERYEGQNFLPLPS